VEGCLESSQGGGSCSGGLVRYGWKDSFGLEGSEAMDDFAHNCDNVYCSLTIYDHERWPVSSLDPLDMQTETRTRNYLSALF